jgi:hypothetical protein
MKQKSDSRWYDSTAILVRERGDNEKNIHTSIDAGRAGFGRFRM